MNWLEHVLGLDDASGRWYLLWSGIFGDVGMFGAAIVYFRRHNCHVKRCPFVGRFPVDGTPYKTCARHHPTVPGPVTVDHIRRAHSHANR